MPIYEYRCKNCDCDFEHFVFRADDPAPTCPTCCGADVEKLISAGAVRPQGIAKGSGGFKPPSCRPTGG
ncbi:MAG: zinc ribbon domain-containing protein [Desulfobacteraceae bacterium]|nr:zinc ribbon domain-containing protein [Desulfobacteraceae bacterium]